MNDRLCWTRSRRGRTRHIEVSLARIQDWFQDRISSVDGSWRRKRWLKWCSRKLTRFSCLHRKHLNMCMNETSPVYKIERGS
jgi:hypothetical protein